MAKKYVEGFPTTQVMMKEWEKKYKFDTTAKSAKYPTGRWYEEVSEVPPGGGGVGGGKEGGEYDYQKLVLDAITNYLKTIGEQKPWKEFYEEKKEELGIPAKTKAVAGITEQVLDVEELLDKLEADVGGRVSGKFVTEAQRRRILAAEAKPLREQLADLVRAETRAGAGLAGARGQLVTMMGLEEKERAGVKEKGLGMLPFWKEAVTFETPEEKFARLLKEEKAKKEAGVSPYYKAPKTGEDIKKSILSNINAAVDQYKLNPEGFRERYTESLVATYGESYRDYINKQVYSLMPDVKPGADTFKPTTSEKSKALSWLTKQPDYSPEDKEKLSTDPVFFYWCLAQAEAEGEW